MSEGRPVPIAWRQAGQRALAGLAMLSLSACLNGPAVDLAPEYQPEKFVLPASWRGDSPFAIARPADGELRADWWKLYQDPILDGLEAQAMAANPDLQAAAERFIQARDVMMKARSRLLPQLGIAFGASDDKQSEHALFRAPNEPIWDSRVALGGLASWEPDFWSAIRNTTRAAIYRAEQRAADFALARLSLQAELAATYFALRGLDAQNAIYRGSIDYYKKSLGIVYDQFAGKLASALDVARAEYLLANTEARALAVEADRQVAEHAIAILVNQAPASFSIAPVDELRMANFVIPAKIPSTLLERRPDIAGMERRMAEANRMIGVARAAFYPHVVFVAGGGFEDNGFNLFQLANSFWSYGASVTLPVFQGGFRRAELQQAWSAYRETVDNYRSTVLNAFREVENGLSLTRLLSAEAERQDAAVAAVDKTQDLTMELFRGGLGTSLELIYAQINTLQARIDAVIIKTNLLRASVGLIRALGGGWNRQQLPRDEQIQPFEPFDYGDIEQPRPAGGIEVKAGGNGALRDLTQPVRP